MAARVRQDDAAPGHVVARALTPGDSLYVAGGEVVLFAGSIEQCRLTYRQALTIPGIAP